MQSSCEDATEGTDERFAVAELHLAHLRIAPLESLRSLRGMLPEAAPVVRSSMHLLGHLMCSEDAEVAAEAEALVEESQRKEEPERKGGQRTFKWRAISVDYWELEAAEGDLLFGYELWPAAKMLARLIINAHFSGQDEPSSHVSSDSSQRRASDMAVADVCLNPKGRSVLELGAGVGLVGLACGACSASRVLLTDGEKRLVDALEEHHSYHCEMAFALLDWTNDMGEEQFDLIVGADVLLGVAHGHVCIPGVIARRLRKCCDARALLCVRIRKGETIATAIDELIRIGLSVSIFQVAGTSGDAHLSPMPLAQIGKMNPEAYVLLVAQWPVDSLCEQVNGRRG